MSIYSSEFSRETIEETTCNLQLESSIPSIGELELAKVVLKSCVYNIAHNKKMSFKLLVTLWVYGKKVQAEALVGSGATTNFIDKTFVETNHLVTYKLATPHNVKNVDGTPNVAGQIKEYVKALVEVDMHQSTQYLFVT